MKRFRLLAVAAALPLAMGACGPTIQTTLEPEWTVPVEMEQHETARVSAEGEAVVVADGKDVRIVDASDGDVVYEEEPEGGLLALLKDEVKLGGLSVSEIEGGDRYGYAFVPGSDLVLLFDNTLAEEEIRALGTATGEVTWRSDEYLWSLGQYGKAAEALLGGVLDGSARGASAPVLAFTKFVDDLSVPVPEKDALLINTVGDLVLADAATGRQIWSVPFGASGIGKALYLPESDDLLILARTRGLVESLTGAKRMMRVDAGTGEVMWSTSYAGQPVPKWVHGDSILDVRVIDDRVLLNFRGAEAYDLETGEQVFDALTGLHGALSSPTGGSVIGSAWTARPLIHDGVAYVGLTQPRYINRYSDYAFPPPDEFANTIAHNERHGIASSAEGIVGIGPNWIGFNAGLGIDLESNGVGSGGVQRPSIPWIRYIREDDDVEVTADIVVPAAVPADGTLMDFDIHVFASSQCDPTGYGEGHAYGKVFRAAAGTTTSVILEKNEIIAGFYLLAYLFWTRRQAVERIADAVLSPVARRTDRLDVEKITHRVEEFYGLVDRMADELGMDYTTIRHHLDVLQDNDIVQKQGGDYGAVYLPSSRVRTHWDTVEQILEQVD